MLDRRQGPPAPEFDATEMIDDFALALTQLLILLALWRITRRRDLDVEPTAKPAAPPPVATARETPATRMPSLLGDRAP